VTVLNYEKYKLKSAKLTMRERQLRRRMKATGVEAVPRDSE